MQKWVFYFFLSSLFLNAQAQLSGIINVPITYTSLASVIAIINQQGVSGALTVNIAANYTETVPQGGFSLTVGGSATNPITFRKTGSGNNPLMYAYSGGTGTPGSMNQDGIWRFVGCDYVSIDGIDLMDLNTSNPATMEFGFGFFKASDTNGCQFNTIQNCVITLNRMNNASGAGPASPGSRGIDVVNALSNVHNAGITVSAFSGSHSNNKFYGNTIQNVNVGISLIGFTGNAAFADSNNDVGGNALSTGNSIVNFGGGGTANAATGIRTISQYNLNVSHNVLNNNTGSGINHPTVLRGIQLNNAPGASSTINHNTLTLQGGGTSSQLTVIENAAGSAVTTNTILIQNNQIVNCTYATATSGSFYGIWNTASAKVLRIAGNTFANNSSSANSGSTYLIYNNGAVDSLVSIRQNSLSFMYAGSGPYTGSMYSIYNADGTMNTSLEIKNNSFSDYTYQNYAGSNALYFIYNTNANLKTQIDSNIWLNLMLNHSGAEYLMHNNAATQSLLTVRNNSIVAGYKRIAPAGATYMYYSTAASPASCEQEYSGNDFSNITASVSGTGSFYGIYSSDGGTGSYPRKIMSDNRISNIHINSSGSFYGYYLDKTGDGNSVNGSAVYNNTLAAINYSGNLFGLYIAANTSSVHASQVFENSLLHLISSGNASSVYGAYLAATGAGLSFHKNKISHVAASGSLALAHGIYVAGSSTTSLINNTVGNIDASNSSANQAVNGIYIQAGNTVQVFYNTVYLSAQSTGGNFNSNALYCFSGVLLDVRNSIFINLSSGGNGIAAAYRRSSTSLLNYASSSGNNLFYAGSPGPTRVILQSGVTTYQSLQSFKTAVAPRDAASVSQLPSFLSLQGASPNFLHLNASVLSLAESGASHINSVNEDVDAQTRQGHSGYPGSGSNPDIGADEFEQNLNPCNSVNAGIVATSLQTICSGQSATLITSGYTPGTGLLHQWKMSQVSGSSYTSVSTGQGYTDPEFISSPLSSGTYYFVHEISCLQYSLSSVSSEVTVVVQPVPVSAALVNSSTVCAGESIQFTGLAASGSFYQWFGPNGFHSTQKNPFISNAQTSSAGNYFFQSFLNSCPSPVFSISIAVSEVSLSLSASSSVVCSGDTISLSLSSSASTYTWSNGANTSSISVSPTVSTLYSVAVSNSLSCFASQNVHIAVVQPSISATPILICGDSSLVLLSVNAFTPSVINWYDSYTANTVLGNGNHYTLAINSSTVLFAEAADTLLGCQSLRIPVTVSLSPYPSLLVSAQPDSVCPGESSLLSASGAYTYSWTGLGSGNNKTVSPSVPATYTVHGKDSVGCISMATLSVGVKTAPVISAVQSATLVCPSAVVGFTASGAATYFWNTGANGAVNSVTPALHTTYTVYGTNQEGCTSTHTLAVFTRSVPVIQITASTLHTCPGQPVYFTASGAISYSWFPGPVVSNTFMAQPLVSSVYNVVGKDINTCTSNGFVQVNVELCSGIEGREQKEDQFFAFPNPATDLLCLKLDMEGEKQITIFSNTGAVVFTMFTDQDVANISVNSLSRGLYHAIVKCKGSVFHKRIVLH